MLQWILIMTESSTLVYINQEDTGISMVVGSISERKTSPCLLYMSTLRACKVESPSKFAGSWLWEYLKNGWNVSWVQTVFVDQMAWCYHTGSLLKKMHAYLTQVCQITWADVHNRCFSCWLVFEERVSCRKQTCKKLTEQNLKNR